MIIQNGMYAGRNGTAAEALQTTLFPVHDATRVILGTVIVTGAGVPLANRLDGMLNDQRTVVTGLTNQLVFTIFNSLAVAVVGFMYTVDGAITHLRWQTQSNAATANSFYLQLRFFDV